MRIWTAATCFCGARLRSNYFSIFLNTPGANSSATKSDGATGDSLVTNYVGSLHAFAWFGVCFAIHELVCVWWWWEKSRMID